MEPTTPGRHRRAERYQNPELQGPVRRVPAEELRPAPAAVPGDRYHRAAPQGIAAPQPRAIRREPQGQAASPASSPAQPWASQAPRPQFTQQPREEAESRLRSQMDPAEKARRADVVIDTSGSIRYTRDSIPPLLAEERRLAALQRSNHGTNHPCAPQAR